MARPKVEFQNTPNPNAGKFTVDRQVTPVGTSRSYYDPSETGDDRLARTLMDLAGVRSVFMVDDFITVTKNAGARWDDLVPAVTQAIRDKLES